MPSSFDGKLVVAISSRALFDFDESHEISRVTVLTPIRSTRYLRRKASPGRSIY